VEADWKREHQGIGIIYEDRIVRVLNDDALKMAMEAGDYRSSKEKEAGEYQRQGKKDTRGHQHRKIKKAFREFAEDIRTNYERQFGGSLPFSAKSMACELYGHYIIKVKAEAIERKIGKKKFTGWLLRHMDVIDCGDRKTDNNRLLWDVLSVFF